MMTWWWLDDDDDDDDHNDDDDDDNNDDAAGADFFKKPFPGDVRQMDLPRYDSLVDQMQNGSGTDARNHVGWWSQVMGIKGVNW